MYDSLSENKLYFHDLTEDTYVQVSRDFFDVVRLHYIQKEDIVKTQTYKYEEFSEDVFNKFISEICS